MSINSTSTVNTLNHMPSMDAGSRHPCQDDEQKQKHHHTVISAGIARIQ